jgi:hypothetical protein
MASTSYGTASWQPTGGNDDMAPGDSHRWFWPLNLGDVFSVSAHPIVGAPESRFLVVENIVFEGGPLEGGQIGRRVNFSVRNAGTTFIPGYILGVSFINE